MYDIGKALTMSIEVLMFIFAASISLYLYSGVDSSINNVMLASNYSNRGDAIVGMQDDVSVREITRSEVIFSILALRDYAVEAEDTPFITIMFPTAGHYVIYDEDSDSFNMDGFDIPFSEAPKYFLTYWFNDASAIFQLSKSNDGSLTYTQI